MLENVITLVQAIVISYRDHCSSFRFSVSSYLLFLSFITVPKGIIKGKLDCVTSPLCLFTIDLQIKPTLFCWLTRPCSTFNLGFGLFPHLHCVLTALIGSSNKSEFFPAVRLFAQFFLPEVLLPQSCKTSSSFFYFCLIITFSERLSLTTWKSGSPLVILSLSTLLVSFIALIIACKWSYFGCLDVWT